MSYIYVFITAFGGASAAILLAAFLGKSLISFYLNKELEAHKAKLSIFAHEKMTKTSRIDQDIAEAIKDIHCSMAYLENHAVKVFLPFSYVSQDLEKILQALCDMGNEFIAFNEAVVHFQYNLELNSIYLDGDLTSEIYNAIKHLKQNTFDAVLEINGYIDSEIKPIPENDRKLTFLHEAKKRFEEDFNQTFYPLRIKLIDKFRSLLKE